LAVCRATSRSIGRGSSLFAPFTTMIVLSLVLSLLLWLFRR
jgi:hypothetical protein